MKLNDPLDLVSVQILGFGVTVSLSVNEAATSLDVCATWAIGCWSRTWVWAK